MRSVLDNILVVMDFFGYVGCVIENFWEVLSVVLEEVYVWRKKINYCFSLFMLVFGMSFSVVIYCI